MNDLGSDWEQNTENILARAYDDNRTVLYEHEIYAILATLGIQVPVHTILHSQDEITLAALRNFGSNRVVLKIISREIPHKLEAGGVRIVYKDVNFVKYSYQSMDKHFSASGCSVEGILMVEFIEHSKSLGNEILLGFRESADFGPVISFSKGGSDAVHFADNFSSPNLILPPIDRAWAFALQKSTKIYSKFVGRALIDHVNYIVDAEIKFSRLAVRFSNFFPSPSRFVITDFEVNPIVFTPEHDVYALDGLAAFALKNSVPIPAAPPSGSLRTFFSPHGIAVFGVSATNSNKSANIILKNLLDLGHRQVAGISQSNGSTLIHGKSIPLHASLSDVPHQVELAVICVPAEATPAAVESCGRKGVTAIILIPGGFCEVTGNRTIEERIIAIAGRYKMRIIGPNCLGIVYAGDNDEPGINTFFISKSKFSINSRQKKNIALISQSGAAGITVIHNLRNAVSPKAIISYGNQIDVDAADMIDYFSSNAAIDVIGVYAEGFKPAAGRSFFNAIARCPKPVVVYKAGRTIAGRRATESHTASIAGEYTVATAAIKQAGGIVAETITDLTDLIKTFALLHDFSIPGDRVAVIANAGYEKTYAADRIGKLAAAQLSDATSERLRSFLPSYIEIDSFLDLTPIVTDDQFAHSVDVMLAAPEVDALCISIVPQAELIHTTDHQIETHTGNIAARIIEIAHRYKKPVVASVNIVPGTDGIYNRFGELLDEGGVPAFLTAGHAMGCLNTFILHRLIKEKKLLSERLK